MQQEYLNKNQQSRNLSQQDKKQLISCIKNIYQGKNTYEIKSSQQKVMSRLENDGKMLTFLYQFIKPPYQMPRNFRMSCANIIKSFYYNMAEFKEADKQKYVSQAYEVLVSTNYQDYQIKQIINIALEHILNKEQDHQLKSKWMNHVKDQLYGIIDNPQAWTLQTIQVIHGLILFCISYLNSLVEPEDQIQFVNSLLNYLCKAANLCAVFAEQNINQSMPIHLLFLAQKKIFQFLQLSAQRLLDQQQIIQQQIQSFKNSQILQNTMIKHLYMFCQAQSIITKYDDLNHIKSSILQILYMMTNYDSTVNITIIQMLFTTFIRQSSRYDQYDNQDDWSEKIISKSMAILQLHLQKKLYYNFFQNNKIQILFALFMYSKTNLKQQMSFVENPDQFVEMGQEYSEGFTVSIFPKIRAANLIKAFVKNFDEALSNIVQLCVLMITGSLKIHQNDSQLLKSAKQEFKDFDFMKLPSRSKLDISFMVLTVISQSISKRADLNAIVTSVLISNFSVISQITDQLVIARVIKVIGYYPNAAYFGYIQKLMGLSRVFLLEGLACFTKITKNMAYREAFQIMHLVYMGIIQYMQIKDQIFEKLINQNYQSIMKKNQHLYLKILQKLYNHFSQCVSDLNSTSSKQGAIACLNYIQRMIKIQRLQSYLMLLENVFIKIQAIGINQDLLIQNFVGIYNVLIQKYIFVSQMVQQFIINFSAPKKLSQYSNFTQYFILLNKYILKTEKQQNLQKIYVNFLDYLGQTGDLHFNYAVVPGITHTIGNILVCNFDVKVHIKTVQFLLGIILNQKGNRKVSQYSQWYIFLTLHYIYIKAQQVRQHLSKEKSYYNFMICLFNTKFTCKIQRKVAVLACLQLLDCQNDVQSKLQIIRYCIIQLNIQKQKYKLKTVVVKEKRNKRKQQKDQQNQNDADQRMRQQQQTMQNQDYKRDEDTIHLKKLKHPFEKICQFSMFKQKINYLASTIKQVKQQNLMGINEILKYQWHKDSIRKVFRIIK